MRLKLTIAYDGRPYNGWQTQACGNTVQDYILRALEEVAKTPVALQGAGRTDAGYTHSRRPRISTRRPDCA